MTVQPIERTDLDIIEALDWEHVPPCESVWHVREERAHGGPAWALVMLTCPLCGVEYGPTYRCRPFVQFASGGGLLKCDAPGGCNRTHRAGLTILGYVGGAS